MKHQSGEQKVQVLRGVFSKYSSTAYTIPSNVMKIEIPVMQLEECLTFKWISDSRYSGEPGRKVYFSNAVGKSQNGSRNKLTNCFPSNL